VATGIPLTATGQSELRTVLRILVVDDERTITSTLSALLQDEGYETAIASSGEEAVQVASSFQPDVIVSDIMMGAINGVEAAIEILRSLPHCRLLFISGNPAYKDLLTKARTKGFKFEVLAKPVPPLELLAKVSQVLSPRADQSGKIERMTEPSNARFVEQEQQHVKTCPKICCK
jgi:CheY-like chemotaxis protein